LCSAQKTIDAYYIPAHIIAVLQRNIVTPPLSKRGADVAKAKTEPTLNSGVQIMATMKKTTAAATAAANAAATQIDEAVAAGTQTIETAVKASAEAVNKGYERAVSLTKENVEAAVKAGSTAFKGYEDVILFNKENVDAVVKSSTIFVKGVQDVSKSFFALTQLSFEEGVALSKTLLGAKTIQDVVEVQSTLVKTSFDKAMAESGRISEMSMKVAEEAFAPINDRMSVAMQRVMKPIAA
jgi:phasin family protein